jgi:hypothetical protein
LDEKTMLLFPVTGRGERGGKQVIDRCLSLKKKCSEAKKLLGIVL